MTGFGLVLQFLLEKGVFTVSGAMGDDMPWISSGGSGGGVHTNFP